MKKILLIIVLANILNACVPVHQGGYGYANQSYNPSQNDYDHQGGQYNSAAPLYYGNRCVRNPYIFALDERNWQLWEKNNYYVSCTTQGGYSYS